MTPPPWDEPGADALREHLLPPVEAVEALRETRRVNVLAGGVFRDPATSVAVVRANFVALRALEGVLADVDSVWGCVEWGRIAPVVDALLGVLADGGCRELGEKRVSACRGRWGL